MFRRFAATLVAVLVLAVVSATPALAKTKDPAKGHGQAGSGPVAGGTTPGGSSGSSGSGTGAGTGSGSAPAPGENDPGSGTSSSGDGKATGSSGKGSGSTKSSGKTKTPTHKPTPSKTASQPTSEPAGRSTAVEPQSTYSSPAPEVTGASVVRASAAPAVADPSVDTALPAPNPLLLPDSATTVAAPVDAERSSGLPGFVPALLVGAGVLSVAVTGTVLARRRSARQPA